jgi:DHA1 family tetracycline resistance protein-like MFS transporter
VDRRFFSIFLIVFIDLVGFGIVIPVLLLHAESSFGASEIQATLLLTAYSIGMVVAGPILGRLSDAFGRRPVLIVSQIGTMIGFIILGLANSLFLLYLGRIIDGLSGGNISTAQAYIDAITTEKNRARGFGLISAAFGAGFIVGPALGGLVVKVTSGIPSLASYSQQAPFFVAAIFSLLSILGTFFILKESLPPEERSPFRRSKAEDVSVQVKRVGLLDVLRITNVRAILTFTVITYLAFSMLQSSFPIFARRNIFPDLVLEDAQGSIGLLLTWIGVINVVMQSFFVGPLVKRFGEQRLIVFGTVVRIFAFLGVGLSRNPLAVGIAFLPLAVGNSVSQPSLQSIISRFAPPSMRGRVLGIFQSTNSLTLIFGPILAGMLLEMNFTFLSPQTVNAVPMFTASALVAVAAVLSLRVLRMVLPSQEVTTAQVESTPAD